MVTQYTGKKHFRFEPSDLAAFLPDYLKERKAAPVNTDPLQRDVYAALKAKLPPKEITDGS